MLERKHSKGKPVEALSGAVGHRRRNVLVAAGVAVLAVGAVYWYASQGSEPARAPRPAVRASVPVSVALATRQDLPLYLTGIGAVQASSTVRIHPQVDGKLQEVMFTEGQRVKKGDVLAKIDPRLYQAALDLAKAKKAQDEALLVAAEKDLTRTKTLASRNYSTEQNLDQQQAKVAQLKASIAADDAAIETAQTQLDYTTITAQNDGRIGMRLVDPGNLIRVSDQVSIATLMLSQPCSVVFTLPSRALDDVRAAKARGEVEVIAFDQANRRPLATGTLLLYDIAVDPATSTIRLKATFPNDDERLWPGDFVNARLLLDMQRNVLTVPSSSVQRGPQGLFAWIVTTGNTAEPQRIEVGSTTGDVTVITAGLSEGDRVVTDGHYKLSRGASVTFTAPASAEVGRVQ